MLTDKQRRQHLAAALDNVNPGHALDVEGSEHLGDLLADMSEREAHIVDHDLRPATLGHDHDGDELVWTGPVIALPPGLVEHYAQRAVDGTAPGWFEPTTQAELTAVGAAVDRADEADRAAAAAAGEAGEIDPAQWAAGLAAGTDVVTVTMADVLSSILADVLNSPDTAAVLVPREPAYIDGIVGQRVTIGSAELQWSDHPDHPGPYALVDALEPQTGRRLLVVVNHRTAAAQVVQLMALGALPVDVIAQQGSRTLPDGSLPVWLTAAPGSPGY